MQLKRKKKFKERQDIQIKKERQEGVKLRSKCSWVIQVSLSVNWSLLSFISQISGETALKKKKKTPILP